MGREFDSRLLHRKDKMPTYNYRCSRCGDLEFYQSMYESPFIDCPKCRSKNFTKIITTPAVTFNGPGFYSTDKGKK
jgi:putative FmdB family regulatory protein